MDQIVTSPIEIEVNTDAIVEIDSKLPDAQVDVTKSITVEIQPDTYVLTSGGMYTGNMTGAVPTWILDAIQQQLTTGDGNITSVLNDMQLLLNGLQVGVNQAISQIENTNVSMSALETSLSSRIDANNAAILDVYATRVTATEAQALAAQAIGATFGGNVDAYIRNLASAYTDANSTIATNIKTLQASYNDQTARIDTVESVTIGNSTAIGNATLALADLEEARDGNVVVYYLTTTGLATGMAYGDYLVDTDSWDGSLYTVYRYENSTGGSSGTLAWYINTGETAKTLSAGYRAQVLAGTAQSTADGKIKTWYQNTAPVLTASDIGDMWVDTDNANKLQVWSGTAWVDPTSAQGTAAYTWSANASKLITAPNGSIVGWQFADGTGVQSTFRINSDVFIIANSADQTQALFENGTFRTYDLQGNFSQLSAGALEFYKASNPNKAYKYLKFIQSGTVGNGETVKLQGFDTLPEVMVSTADIMIYNKDFGGQSQALKTYPAELKMVNGVVSFKPTAKLVVAGASNISSIDWTYTNSGTITTSTKTTPPNTKKIEVSLSVNSIRSVGVSGSWYRRTSSLQMQLYNGSIWYNVGQAVTVNHTNLTQNNVVVSSGEISPSTHTYRVVATFVDTGGTFTAPVDWIYFSETVANYSTTRLHHHVWPGGGTTDTRSVSLSYSLKAGEELVNSSYSVEIALINHSARGHYYRLQALGRDTETVYTRNHTGVQKDLLGPIGSGFKAFSYEGLSSLTETTQVKSEVNSSLSGDHASITVDVRNRVLTLNLRKPTSLSTTATNTLSATTAAYDLSEEEELASGFVNYIAIG